MFYGTLKIFERPMDLTIPMENKSEKEESSFFFLFYLVSVYQFCHSIYKENDAVVPLPCVVVFYYVQSHVYRKNFS